MKTKRKILVIKASKQGEPLKFAKKTGRNDKCPCKSGVKYKACCLLKSMTKQQEQLVNANKK